ncbi:hypothetical protein [Paraburkholderia sp. UYCP14C]|uniref:hypothetical protein n=1 Tax=Paraburkholderia sp. UYCP14C TaxID=2511130 RepID=UPI001B7D51DE|nr:hypothetical protein [Paraburkholderia sp. UYCP14C]
MQRERRRTDDDTDALGMSWALGIGRIGSVVGSMAGGYLLGLHWTASEMLTLMAAVLVIATLGAPLLTPLMRHAALASAGSVASEREHAALAAGTGRVD